MNQDGVDLVSTWLIKKNNEEILRWQYVTGETCFDKALPKVQEHFQKAMELKGKIKSNQDLNKAIQSVAKMHWWMIHALPFDGGTAGISDMLSKTVFKTIGIKTSNWKKGVVPDMDALLTPLDKYVESVLTPYN